MEKGPPLLGEAIRPFSHTTFSLTVASICRTIIREWGTVFVPHGASKPPFSAPISRTCVRSSRPCDPGLDVREPKRARNWALQSDRRAD